MRAHEILMENTDYLQVPAGVWKQVIPREHHDHPRWHGNPYGHAHYDKPSTKAWELHTNKGVITVLNNGPGEVRHVQGYDRLTPDWLRQNLQPLLQKARLSFDPDSDLQIVDGELVWVSREFPLTPLVSTGRSEWFKVSVAVYLKYYQKAHDPAQVPPQSQGDLYVLRNSEGRNVCAVVVNNNRMVVMTGYVRQEELTPLLDMIHVQESDINSHVFDRRAHVQDGQLRNTDYLLTTNQVGELSDGSKVYEVEPEHRPLIQTWFKKQYANADHVYLVQNPLTRAVFAIKSGKIVGKATITASPATLKKWSLLLASDVNLGIDKPDSAQIKPGSFMHRMLAHIKQHPGGNRSDVFKHGLGRKSILGLGSINDQSTTDGFAWKTGLIQPYAPGTKSYAYTITPKGKMLLAMLDAGKSVPEDQLMDWTKT
jgi:hypothetical protein